MKVDYKKRWGENGTCYSQFITIDSWIMAEYNNYLNKLKKEIENNFKLKKTYSEKDLNIKSIDFLKKGINFTNLIHLDIFLMLLNELNKKGYNFNFKRVLYRNTIIKAI